MRATIIVTVDEPESVAAGKAWFARWRPHLAYCSGNTGCGCCVDIWDVDAPEEAVAELPWELRAMSEWTHPDIPGVEPVQRVWLRRTVRRKWKKRPYSRD